MPMTRKEILEWGRRTAARILDGTHKMPEKCQLAMDVLNRIDEEVQANLAAISYNDEYQHGYEDCGAAVLRTVERLKEEIRQAAKH